jgi:hypothetical protein
MPRNAKRSCLPPLLGFQRFHDFIQLIESRYVALKSFIKLWGGKVIVGACGGLIEG